MSAEFAMREDELSVATSSANDSVNDVDVDPMSAVPPIEESDELQVYQNAAQTGTYENTYSCM